MTQELSEAEATPVWVVVGTDDDEGALYGVFATPELAQEHADEFDDGTVTVQCEPVIGSEAAGVTVPTNNEEAERIAKHVRNIAHYEGITEGQASVLRKAANLLAARRLPVSGDNAEARNQWNDAVQAERQRQRDKGYDASHDAQHGVDHLLMEAQEYARRGESVKSAALIEAARELLLSASQPREVEAAPSDTERKARRVPHTGPGHAAGDPGWCEGCSAELHAAQPVQVEVTEGKREALANWLGQYRAKVMEHPIWVADWEAVDALLDALGGGERKTHSINLLRDLGYDESSPDVIAARERAALGGGE